ncbi:uncharacterized protein LOC126376814 [Pectinophora gossypiella]|uniref:uncharacterized protein LOC126376814 n=1 Tax=Pectinophora gossypiella TaxID=13191 RepID=UPI00214E24C8|nr:uncharacterized protein LOC126376814 [Pectinophora gossypiella]
MSAEKISSEEVPGKFTEWLLAMGCPADKVPSVENIGEMCRGQYYMVWRSLMEQVDAKDVVRRKRLQVFCDDIRRCKKKNVFNECETNTLMPEQLLLWKQQAELRQKVKDATDGVSLARRDLDQLMDKNCSKSSRLQSLRLGPSASATIEVFTPVAQRNQARNKAENAARRAYFLQGLAEELRGKTEALQETQDIADSLCSTDDGGDIQSKLDRCLSWPGRAAAAPAPPSNTTASSAGATNGDADFEELVCQLVRGGGAALCSQLCSRRGALLRGLAGAGSPGGQRHKLTPQSVLAHTAALHCTLSLEATKHKIHLKQTKNRLLSTVTELNNYLSGEACELLVLRCEVAHASARVSSLRSSLQDLTSGSGVFHTHAHSCPPPATSLAKQDAAIESKKEELKRVMTSLAGTERKIQSVRECLTAVFTALHNNAPLTNAQYRGVQLDLPSESISSLRQFYDGRCESRPKLDVSLELEVSDGSITDNIDYNNPRFVDELRLYLKNFKLENNRQLVLESGEKVWIFETVQASMDRLRASWLAAEQSCRLLAAAAALPRHVRGLLRHVRSRTRLEDDVRPMGAEQTPKEIDIQSQVEEEAQIIDKTKKRLRECVQDLQRTAKTFTLGQENLRFWSENQAKKYILPSRKLNGMTYTDYEIYYLENCMSI